MNKYFFIGMSLFAFLILTFFSRDLRYSQNAIGFMGSVAMVLAVVLHIKGK